MPKKMTLERFVAKGRAAQEAVDAAVTEHTPADALLAGETVDGVGVRITTPPGGEEYRYIPLGDITLSPTQPRDRARISGPKFEELVASVRENGVKTPIVVRYIPHLEGSPPLKYELIAGERRLLAAKEAGLPEIPAIIRQATQGEAMIEQLIENLLRDDLDPIEEARGYQNTLAVRSDHAGQLETGEPLYTQESLARRLGVSQPHIAQRLGLLKLPESVQTQVAAGAHAPSEEARALSPAHARVLVPFADYPWILEAVQQAIKEEGLPPAKEFPEFLYDTLLGATPMLVRPLTEGQFLGRGQQIQFSPQVKSLPRNWSQLGQQVDHLVEPGPCTNCPHARVLKGPYGGRESRYCMLSTCWEGKQQAHRKVVKQDQAEVDEGAREKVKGAKADPARMNVGSLKQDDYRVLTRGKGADIPDYTWKEKAPIFDVELCKTKCPFKTDDGGKAYRQGFKIVKGQVVSVGAVCLRPKHFLELQTEEAGKRIARWKEGTLARLKGLAKQAAKGLGQEDLVALVLRNLDGDLEHRDVVRVIGWQKARVSMVEFFAKVFGLTDRGLTKQALAKHPRKELETWLKFALLWRKADKIRR